MPAVTIHAAAKANPSRTIGPSIATGLSIAFLSSIVTVGRGRHQ